LKAVGSTSHVTSTAEATTGRMYGVMIRPNVNRMAIEVITGCDALNKMIPVTKLTAASGLLMTVNPMVMNRAGQSTNFHIACKEIFGWELFDVSCGLSPAQHRLRVRDNIITQDHCTLLTCILDCGSRHVALNEYAPSV
jgi:hypothetical protein